LRYGDFNTTASDYFMGRSHRIAWHLCMHLAVRDGYFGLRHLYRNDGLRIYGGFLFHGRKLAAEVDGE
jgi:hypothetical protein